MKKILLLVLLVCMIGLVAVGVDTYRKIWVPYQGYDQAATVLVEPGSPVSEIAKRLYYRRVISSSSLFIAYYKLFHSARPLQSGEYRFSKPLTMAQVIEKLHQGKVVLHRVTVKEGLTIEETAEVLESEYGFNKNQFLEAAANPELISDLDPEATDLEGYLYPDTYMIDRTVDAKRMVGLMVNHFRKEFDNALRWRARDMNFSIRDTVILASLIEKETALREERFLISSVFHNRLRIGMPLASDPTIIYALKQRGEYTGDIRWKDLEMDSPYNTRVYKGLPPGPICSVGFDSLEAALFPAASEYLYFVAKDNRSHYFSKTLREHNWAVRKYILKQDDQRP